MAGRLFMGNGDHSAARCYEHVEKLLRLHSELGGLQQFLVGPLAVSESDDEYREAEDAFEHEAWRFLKELAADFGVPIKKKKPKEQHSGQRERNI